jgi:glycosyltransferase involved in cell wall biosynthesis
MVENILDNKQPRVALLSPGAMGQTAIAHFGATFAKVMRRDVLVDYISETVGEYEGLPFKPAIEFKREKYDVAHFQWGNNPLHLFEFSLLLGLGNRKSRPLIVSTLHEAELGYLIGASEQARRYRRYFKLHTETRGTPKDSTDYAFFSHYTMAEILKRSDCIIVHSEYTKRRIIAEHRLRESESDKIQVARLGVDWNDYAASQEYGEVLHAADGNEPMVFLYVGSLHSIKSIDKVIKALHMVKHFGRRNSFYFVVVGSGPEYEDLNFLAEILIPGCYCFAGPVPSVLPYYQLADVVVCPRAFSRGEVSGSIPEACAAGKPLILPKIGGWNEYIDDSRGFPVAADDELDYAKAFLHCLENPSEVTEKGFRARHFAEQSLSWQSQRELFLAMYSRARHRS